MQNKGRLALLRSGLLVVFLFVSLSEKPFVSLSRKQSLCQMPSFLRMSLGMAFLLMRKSMVFAATKALVMYHVPL